jgi:hypothetical protein
MDPAPKVRRFHTDPVDLPVLRLIIGAGQAGGTALLRAFATHSQVAAVYHPIRAGQRVLGAPDYRIYARHPLFDVFPGRAFVAEEAAAPAQGGPPVDLFPHDAAVRRVRPVFLFRDPSATWSALRGGTPGGLEPFLTAYRHAIDLYERATAITGSTATCLTVEHLENHPETILQTICARWGLTHEPATAAWTRPLDLHSPALDIAPTAHRDPRGWATSTRTRRTLRHPVPSVDLPRAERARIREVLAGSFEALHEEAQATFPAAPAPRRTVAASIHA